MKHYDKLWWFEEGLIAGMPQPPLDEVKDLYDKGIRAIGSFLETEDNLDEYRKNGIEVCWIPVEDDEAPSLEQVKEFSVFVEKMKDSQLPLAVHCKGGNGRAGTMLAAHYVLQGEKSADVLASMRAINPKAVRTKVQEDFLSNLEGLVK